MVGGAEGPLDQKGAALVGQSHDRVHLGGLQGLPPGHVRQDGGQTAGQHGLAGAGWAHHGQIVPARGGDLQGPLGGILALDLGEVGTEKVLRRGPPGRGGGDKGLPLQMGHQLPDMLHWVNRQPTGQSGLGGGAGGYVQ